ncbi:MAG: hypothetical protein IJO29_06475 [Oscillospiraceae bacterium]|nr:hypothetical protein [Oscillospiraceae bacterium]
MNTIFKYETASNAETAQFKEENINMTEKYFKIRAIVVTVFIIVTFAVFAVSCDKNSAETENSNTTTTQVTTTTSDEDDVTTTARPKETTTTKATTTAVTTTTTTMATTTTNGQTTATTPKATTTTPQQTTVTTTTTTKQEVSENAEMVAEIIRQLGGTPKDTLESYVSSAETMQELRDAIQKYLEEEQPEYEVISEVTRVSSEELLMMVEYYQTPVIIEENGEIKLFRVSESWEYDNLACRVIVIQKQGEL